MGHKERRWRAVPALRYRAKPMTKGFTTEGGMRFPFPPYALKII